MTTATVSVGALIITSPFTAITNIGIGVTCLLWARRLRRVDACSGLWRRFFCLVGLAMILAAPKHGLALYKAHPWVSGPILASGLLAVAAASCAHVIVAQHLALSEAAVRRIAWATPLQLGGFLGGVASGWSFLAVLMFVVPGLLALCVVEWVMWRRGSDGHLWSALGLSCALVPTATYLRGWPQWGWFNHVDLAHLMVWAALWAVVRGTRQQAVRGVRDGC